MGNSASSSSRGHHEETVDHGYLSPQGVYTGTRDWNQAIVTQLICARKLAPFYRPLEDYDDSWDDDQILAARKEFPPSEHETVTRIEATMSPSSSSRSSNSKKPANLKEPSKPEVAVYRGAVECPICFLYYPPNINHSRCCDQAICTECFVQIKRNEPTTTHLVSEPAACPYCVQENFGVVYTPPPWRAGIGADGFSPSWADLSRAHQQLEGSSTPGHKRRQKSFGADSPEVVTTDQIRPDWEAKLAAVQAAVARRANRRIIMRQVGDRLIPVGITSGRVHALSPEEAGADSGEASGSRRSRRRPHGAQNQQYEQFIGMGGQDLEELMIMEAMRLSMIEHEERQRKEAEEKRKAEAVAPAAQSASAPDADLQSASSPGPSTLASNQSPSSSSTPSPAPTTTTHDSSASKRNSIQSSNSGVISSSTQPHNTRTLNTPNAVEQRRTPSPEPYNTWTAALAAASTPSPTIPSSHSRAASTNTANCTPVLEASSIPQITVGDDAKSDVNGISADDHSGPSRRIKHQDSVKSTSSSIDRQSETMSSLRSGA